MRRLPIKGLILYEGPSLFDDAPIVVLATGFARPSQNLKTGWMVQTWILRQDIEPTVAITTAEDYSVCGDCPLRRSACYVNAGHAPRQVWTSWRDGAYEPFDRKAHLRYFGFIPLRIGAYGDPCASPLRVWTPLIKTAPGHTGYSHAWRERRFWRWRQYLMASCETLQDVRDAQSRGWRTFRATLDLETRHASEIGCPASEEEGYRATCSQCRLCDGSAGNSPKSIVIGAHGALAKMRGFRKVARAGFPRKELVSLQ